MNGGRAPSSPLSTSSPTWSPRPQSSPPPQAPFTLLSLISRWLLPMKDICERYFFSPGLAMTTIVLSLNWLVVDFCYYGLSLHSGLPRWVTSARKLPPPTSVGEKNFSSTKQYQHIFSSPVNLAGDIFLNFVLSAAVEVKSLCITTSMADDKSCHW